MPGERFAWPDLAAKGKQKSGEVARLARSLCHALALAGSGAIK
jgi:hypothetical protein